jgi:hypothetical protein
MPDMGNKDGTAPFQVKGLKLEIRLGLIFFFTVMSQGTISELFDIPSFI